MTRLCLTTILACLLLAALPGLAWAQNLLTNGDFEQDLSVGWTRADSGAGMHTINRDTSYHPDPDYEAYVYQYDNPGWTKLSQRVDVSGVQLDLSFWAKFDQSGGTSSCWPAACFRVCYYDAADLLLGETRYFYSTYANWVPSPILSLVRITDPDWNQYTLSILDELIQNLPGVEPADVAAVEVAAYNLTVSG